MIAQTSIFFEFNLPNATTWFYFSWLLAMALFFKFSRLLSVRNWDVITLFLLVPGLLLLQESRTAHVPPGQQPAVALASLVLDGGGQALASPVTGWHGLPGAARLSEQPFASASRSLWLGYLWLLCGSVYFWLRCLLDLALVRRPALSPNLNLGGLAWLAGALFICLAAVAFRYPEKPAPADSSSTQQAPAENGEGPVGRQSVFLNQAQQQLGADFWALRSFALLCHLSVVAGLILIGALHFQDASAGMAAATFYLMLPYTGQYVGQWDHVFPMALMIWAVALYRKPTLAGLFLGLAAGIVYFPLLVLPIWLSFYWGRGSGRFSVAFLLAAGLCLAVAGLVPWLSDDLSPILTETLSLPAWQAWRVPAQEGFWTGVHWAYRMPVFIAYLAFLITTAFWPTPKNLAHVIALSAAGLIGLQFWYADQGGVYVLWYLPLLLLLVFRPNLAERRPVPIQAETDWLRRSLRVTGRLILWLLKIPEPLTRVR